MIAEIGHFSLIVALAMALAQSMLSLVGAHTGNTAWMSLSRPFLFIATAYGRLTASFVNNDFSVLLAAQHSNFKLALMYRITAVTRGPSALVADPLGMDGGALILLTSRPDGLPGRLKKRFLP